MSGNVEEIIEEMSKEEQREQLIKEVQVKLNDIIKLGQYDCLTIASIEEQYNKLVPNSGVPLLEDRKLTEFIGLMIDRVGGLCEIDYLPDGTCVIEKGRGKLTLREKACEFVGIRKNEIKNQRSVYVRSYELLTDESVNKMETNINDENGIKKVKSTIISNEKREEFPESNEYGDTERIRNFSDDDLCGYATSRSITLTEIDEEIEY
ncbi:MAG TPA: hypothetical protein DEP72_02665 [Clostridiales bacterium]|nr:MAG: hypothetical protein A2Y18_06500 [Clostridiales bacterium GWD2_32_19]HCC07057.1 hypothetical protein [Clostridiales bacterium]